MQEFDLVITLSGNETEKQMEMINDFVKGYELSNPEAKVMVITPRPPRG